MIMQKGLEKVDLVQQVNNRFNNVTNYYNNLY